MSCIHAEWAILGENVGAASRRFIFLSKYRDRAKYSNNRVILRPNVEIVMIFLCNIFSGARGMHYGNPSRGYLIGVRPLWPPAVPRLAARSSQSNPMGSGPEVLKRERGHVIAETGVAEVGVFRALQPNAQVIGQSQGWFRCLPLLSQPTRRLNGGLLVRADAEKKIKSLMMIK